MIRHRLRSWLARRRPGRWEERTRPRPDAVDVELHARGVADALWAGTRPSVFRGSGVEADGVRGYVPGDDTRAVDWKVTARTGRLHVRELVEERSTDVVLVLDRSAFLHEGPSPRPGRAALMAAGILASAADRSGHRVGLVEAGASLGAVLPPSLRRGHVEALLATASAPGSLGGSCDLTAGLERARALLSGRALVVLVSDFRVPAPARNDVAAALSRLVRRHDVLPVRVHTPGPEDLPSVGQVRVSGTEGGAGRAVDTSDPRWRATVRALAEEREAWWQDVVTVLGLEPLDLDPFASVGAQIRAGLEHRRRRVA